MYVNDKPGYTRTEAMVSNNFKLYEAILLYNSERSPQLYEPIQKSKILPYSLLLTIQEYL